MTESDTWALLPGNAVQDSPTRPTLDLKCAEVLRGSVILRANLGSDRTLSGERTRTDLETALRTFNGALTP